MDVFTTSALTRVVEALDRPVSFLLDMMFGVVQTEDSEEIHFDSERFKRRITPFVSPLVAGKIVDRLGFDTTTFKPAYAKDKRIFQPNKPLKRAIGEQIGGTMSPQDRRLLALRLELEDQLEMLTRREEVMAAEALRTGMITVSGEGFDTKVVDFGRDPSLTVTLAGVDLWSAGTSTPLKDIENWASVMQGVSGAVQTDVIMEPNAWQAFSSHAAVDRVLDIRRGGSSRADLGPLAGKVRQPGSIGDFTFWVYNDSYIDDAGATQMYLPSGTVILGGPQVEGARAYGVIQDEEAQYRAQRFFAKSWLEKDPAVRYLLMQSAPLPVPYRIDASLAASVL